MRNDNGQELESPMTSQAGVSYVYFDYTLSMICQVSSTDIFWMFFDGDLKLFDIWFDMWTHILIKPFPAKILTFIERCLNDWYQRYLNCRLDKDNVIKVIRWKDIMILIYIYLFISMICFFTGVSFDWECELRFGHVLVMCFWVDEFQVSDASNASWAGMALNARQALGTIRRNVFFVRSSKNLKILTNQCKLMQSYGSSFACAWLILGMSKVEGVLLFHVLYHCYISSTEFTTCGSVSR